MSPVAMSVGDGADVTEASGGDAVASALFARLQEFPLDLMQHGDTAERRRDDVVAVAIDHLQTAIDALDLASED